MEKNPTALRLMIKSGTIFIIPFGVLSIGFLIWVTDVVIKEIDLKMNGIELYAHVIDKWEDEEWEKNLIEYKFVHNDLTYINSSSVRYKIYQRTHLGDDIIIITDPNNPDNNKMYEQDIGNMAFPYFYLMSFLALLFGYMGVHIVVAAILKAHLYRIGVSTKGVIDDIIHSMGVKNREKKYNITISFQDQFGTQYSKTFKHQSRIMAARVRKEQEVIVIYNPKSPRQCTIPKLDGIEVS